MDHSTHPRPLSPVSAHRWITPLHNSLFTYQLSLPPPTLSFISPFYLLYLCHFSLSSPRRLQLWCHGTVCRRADGQVAVALLSSPPSLSLSLFRSDWRRRSTTASIGEQVNTQTHAQRPKMQWRLQCHASFSHQASIRDAYIPISQSTSDADIWSIRNNASQFHTYHKHFSSNRLNWCILTDPEVAVGLLNYPCVSLLPKHPRLYDLWCRFKTPLHVFAAHRHSHFKYEHIWASLLGF